MSKEQSAANGNAELKNVLAHQNAVHALYACIGCAVLIPLYMLVTKLAGLYGDHATAVRILLIIMEVFQLAAGFFTYFLAMSGETEKLSYLNRVYFYGNAVFLTFLARAELAYTGNYLVYVADALFCSVLPIWSKTDRRYYMYPLALLYLVTSATAGAGWTKFLIVALLAAAMIGLSIYLQEMMIEHAKLTMKLRAKTLTSERDPLTKLTNRRGLDRKANVLWPYCARTATTIGIIEIDIDFFKKYNDRFGHPAGDKCLKKVASAIRSSAKRASDVSARIGGEEFVIFVQGMTEQELVGLAMKVRSNIDALKIPHAYIGVSKYVTVSMGAALITPDSSNSFEDLYEAADKALYQAKENGRNCVVCNGKIYGKMRGGLSMRVSG